MQRDQADQDEQKDTFQRTTQKPQGHLIESKYQVNENEKAEENNDASAQLDQIQSQIKTIAKRLEEIKYEQLKETDKSSDNYISLEEERKDLKKNVIDLDFRHRQIIANSMRESRKRQTEEKQKIIKEAQEQRERRIKQLDEKYKKERQQREQLSSEKNKEQGEQGQQKQKKQEQKQEQNLDQSRRKLRIAQIQSELASQRLRRSRTAALNAQLDYLRISYTYPYLGWRDYYPYSLYPYTSYARPLYPYPSYSSYLYPSYRYRWWL